MKPSRASAVLALVVAATLVGAGASDAAPGPVDPEGLVAYQVKLVDDASVSTSVENGYFRVAPDRSAIELADVAGQTIETLPLSYTFAGKSYSIESVIGDDMKQLTLMPAKLPPDIVAVAAGGERQVAWDNVMKQVVIGWNNQGLASTAAGAAIGFAVGCVSIFPNFIAGCIVGTVIGAGVGAGAGVVNGNPEVRPAISGLMDTFLP